MHSLGYIYTRGSWYDSPDQKCDWCDWCDLWLAFNFGPWFFFVIDVIGVINVISVIGVIDVIDVIQLSQNMIWRSQFHVFLYFLSSLVFFCFSTPENFHPLKLWKSSDNAFLYRKLCISCSISDQKLHILCFFLYFIFYTQKFRWMKEMFVF